MKSSSKIDPRVDTYIAKAAVFAQPIMKRLRTIILSAHPEIQETIKWRMPAYEYKGLLCSYAAFKAHAVFGFWKYKLIEDPHGVLGERSVRGGAAMGNLGRMESIKDLPKDSIIKDFVRQAIDLNEKGIAMEKPKAKPKPMPAMPELFAAAFKKNKVAEKEWKAFSASMQREYLEWVTEAKTEATQLKRITQAVEWIAEGKKRNWKYEKL